MIPLREQEQIRQLFGQALVDDVRIEHFTQRDVGLFIPGREPCQMCKPTRQMLEELAALSEKISLRVYELAQEPQAAAKWGIDKVPGTVISSRQGRSFKFYGIPSGNEFSGFVDTIIGLSRGAGAVALTPETRKQLRRLKKDVRVQVFLTPT